MKHTIITQITTIYDDESNESSHSVKVEAPSNEDLDAYMTLGLMSIALKLTREEVNNKLPEEVVDLL